MEYPELGWKQIQELREKLGTADRKLVESLLDKIESLWVELERTRIAAKPEVSYAHLPHDAMIAINAPRPDSPTPVAKLVRSA